MENRFFNAINSLISVQKLHKHLIDVRMQDIGIHRTQHRILMHLSRKGNLPSQKELAALLGITPAAVTGALQKLESDGYIKRQLGSDNRYNEILITDLGKEIVEKTRKLFSEIDESIFSGFGEEELDCFIKYLERIRNNADEEITKGKL